MSDGMIIINGYREQDNGGFTYLYGKHKGGRHAARNKFELRRMVRADKKRARNIDSKIFNAIDFGFYFAVNWLT